MSTIADELLTLLDTKESLRLAINAQGNDLKVDSPLTIFAQGIRPVDTEMSLTSENLVQNKVITKYIDDKTKNIGIGTFKTVNEIPSDAKEGEYYFLRKGDTNATKLSNNATTNRRLTLSIASRD